MFRLGIAEGGCAVCGGMTSGQAGDERICFRCYLWACLERMRDIGAINPTLQWHAGGFKELRPYLTGKGKPFPGHYKPLSLRAALVEEAREMMARGEVRITACVPEDQPLADALAALGEWQARKELR